MNEARVRDRMCRLARSLYERGYSVGTAGNISAKLDDGLLITPTNSCLGFLEPQRLSKLDVTGTHIAGDPPLKEIFLHQAFYETRTETRSVVHLHSTYATALSCLADLDRDDCLLTLTPYIVMRVGRVKLVDYVRPGDPRMGELIRALQGQYAAVLLSNHGLVIAGTNLGNAVFAAEEMEESAKLQLILRDKITRTLSSTQIEELISVFR